MNVHFAFGRPFGALFAIQFSDVCDIYNINCRAYMNQGRVHVRRIVSRVTSLPRGLTGFERSLPLACTQPEQQRRSQSVWVAPNSQLAVGLRSPSVVGAALVSRVCRPRFALYFYQRSTRLDISPRKIQYSSQQQPFLVLSGDWPQLWTNFSLRARECLFSSTFRLEKLNRLQFAVWSSEIACNCFQLVFDREKRWGQLSISINHDVWIYYSAGVLR